METNNRQAHIEKANKPRYSLIPAAAMEEIAKVFSHGAKKYGDFDWENIDDPNVFLDAIGRHYYQLSYGKPYDKESGLHHLAHIAANCMMYLAQENENVFDYEVEFHDGSKFLMEKIQDEDAENTYTRLRFTEVKKGHGKSIKGSKKDKFPLIKKTIVDREFDGE